MNNNLIQDLIQNIVQANREFKKRVRNGNVDLSTCISNKYSCYFCNNKISGETIIMSEARLIRSRLLITRNYSDIECYKTNISKEVC